MVVTESTFSWRFPSFLGYIPLFRNLKTIRFFMGTTHLGLAPGMITHGWRTLPEGDAWLAEQYQRHNQDVINHVPADQLLVFNVKAGWGPLCQFLGKPIPPNDAPFPHVKINTRESLLQLRQQFQMIVYGWIPTLTAIVVGSLYWWRSGHSKHTK
jgi:hypothetical protein